MKTFTYEIHTTSDPLLPFRFRPCMDVTRRQSLPNWHEEPEILYCFEGAGSVRLGGKSVPFRKGDAVVVDTRTPHFVESSESVHYCCLIVKNGFLTENGVDPASLHFQSRIFSPQMQEKMEDVRTVFAAYDPNCFHSVLQIRSAVLSLFALLCKNHASPLEHGAKADESVNRALTYLHKHFREKLTLDQVASFAGVSKFHLSREFKRSTGRTIMDTVILLRLEQARVLLEQGERVSDAARACGFWGLSYFSKSFQNRFGILPSQMGKKNGNTQNL